MEQDYSVKLVQVYDFLQKLHLLSQGGHSYSFSRSDSLERKLERDPNSIPRNNDLIRLHTQCSLKSFLADLRHRKDWHRKN